ncbi:MAG: hypothetical protein BVN33_17545 [Proteobacteria bacterium ST_bin13]|nr:MAG: hypothetical protein BVN33_17545 [Proteobacteria bacterium ST_bin13]
MTSTVNDPWRPWLPDNTAAPKIAMGALAGMADGWSRAWIAGEPLRAAGALVRIDPRSELRQAQWHTHDGGLTIGLSTSGLTALGAQVLGVSVANRSLADTALLDAVGGECIDDLKRCSAAVLGLPEKGWSVASARPAGTVHRLEIASPARNPVLTLDLSVELFVALIKTRLPAAPLPSPLGRPADALATLPVSLSTLLGRSAITVAELSGLARGDVLVLDRALDAPLPLSIGGKPAFRGTCTISEDGSALQIIEPLIG